MKTEPRRGRPPRHPDNQRSLYLHIRISRLEKAQITAEAAELGVKVSDMVRRRALRSERDSLPPVIESSRRPRAVATAIDSGDDELAALVAQFSRTMPLRNAESLARTELQRRKDRTS